MIWLIIMKYLWRLTLQSTHPWFVSFRLPLGVRLPNCRQSRHAFARPCIISCSWTYSLSIKVNRDGLIFSGYIVVMYTETNNILGQSTYFNTYLQYIFIMKDLSFTSLIVWLFNNNIIWTSRLDHVTSFTYKEKMFIV